MDPRTSSLTPQERRVLVLVGGGLTNRQIAAEMFLAEKTVKNYVSSLLAKLGFERRTQAAVFIASPAAPVRLRATGTAEAGRHTSIASPLPQDVGLGPRRQVPWPSLRGEGGGGTKAERTTPGWCRRRAGW